MEFGCKDNALQCGDGIEALKLLVRASHPTCTGTKVVLYSWDGAGVVEQQTPIVVG